MKASRGEGVRWREWLEWGMEGREWPNMISVPDGWPQVKIFGVFCGKVETRWRSVGPGGGCNTDRSIQTSMVGSSRKLE